MKNHSKEEQEQVKLSRESWSQGRSTDNSQEGLLDEGPNLAALCPPIGQQFTIGVPPGYEVGGNAYEPVAHRRPEVSTLRRGKLSLVIVIHK